MPPLTAANPPVRIRRGFHAVRAKKMRSSVEMTESGILFLRPHLRNEILPSVSNGLNQRA